MCCYESLIGFKLISFIFWQLESQRVVSTEQVIQCAKDLNCCAYIECSACEYTNSHDQSRSFFLCWNWDFIIVVTGKNIEAAILACLDAAFENLVLVELTAHTLLMAEKGRSSFNRKLSSGNLDSHWLNCQQISDAEMLYIFICRWWHNCAERIQPWL